MPRSLKEFGYVRVGTVSGDVRIANPSYNTDLVIKAIDEALKNHCRFLVFPELNLTSYTCGDLFFQRSLLKKVISGLLIICEYTSTTKTTVVIGAPLESSGKLFNCALVISNGDICGVVPKSFLCNTNEYYEERWFSSAFDRTNDMIEINGQYVPFGEDLIFEANNFRDFKFGIEICEDMWAVKPPSNDLATAGATVICNLSASNEYLGKTKARVDLVKAQSAKCIAAYIYSSCGPDESTTDTLFSGHSLIVEYGKILSETERYEFKDEIAYADIDLEMLTVHRNKNNSFGLSLPERPYRNVFFEIEDTQTDKLLRKIEKNPFLPDIYHKNSYLNEVLDIQSTALASRLKHINCNSVVIGISGGLDSTLALLVSVLTFKKLGLNIKNIYAISLPGFGTSDRTKDNAKELSEAFGVTFKQVSIDDAVIQHFKDIQHDANIHDIVYENAQARERTQILMDYANKVNGILIGTGDMSELALGWCTYGGDQIAMYNVNAGVPKTLIQEVLKWYAETLTDNSLRMLLIDIVDTPISPELIPGTDFDGKTQRTEDTVGPYELHDFFLNYVVKWHFSPRKILFLAEQAFGDKYEVSTLKSWLKVFYSRFFKNQFKRSAMPDGVKVTGISLSPRGEWRMPSDADVKLWLEELDN